MRIYDTAVVIVWVCECVAGVVGGGGCGEAGGWMPLPTRPQRYCDPTSLVLPYLLKWTHKISTLNLHGIAGDVPSFGLCAFGVDRVIAEVRSEIRKKFIHELIISDHVWSLSHRGTIHEWIFLRLHFLLKVFNFSKRLDR